MITSLEIPKKAIGNALFNFAVLLSVGFKTGLKPIFPSGREYVHHSGQLIQMLNNGFKISTEIKEPNKIFVKFNFIEKQENKFDEKIFKIKEDTNLIGYFQNILYFVGAERFIKDNLRFLETVEQQSKNIFENLKIKPMDFVSMHVRRGDFLRLNNHHPSLDLEYYKRAMSQKVFKDRGFLIFSDDHQWCIENFNKDNIIVMKTHENAFVDLCMMSKCRGNIIANSTFSWWAAFLNENDEVVYPEKWFGEAKGYQPNLFYKDWIKL